MRHADVAGDLHDGPARGAQQVPGSGQTPPRDEIVRRRADGLPKDAQKNTNG
jgi:hypothetical protein